MQIQVDDVVINLEFFQDDEFSDPFYLIFNEDGFYVGRIEYDEDDGWMGSFFEGNVFGPNWFIAMAFAIQNLDAALEKQRNNFWYRLAECWYECVDWVKSKFK